MKTKNIAVVFVALIIMLVSCSKEFLDRPPQSQVVGTNFYQNDAEMLAGAAPLYSMVWKDFCDQANWHIGDAHAGVLMYPWGGNASQFSNFTANGLTGTNVSAYKAFYEVIVQANTIMYNIEHYATSAVTPAIKQHTLGECRYMRALALSYLVMNYGPVAIADENYVKTLIESGGTGLPQLRRNTVPSVWKFIVKDFRYAVLNLEQTAPLPGRITSWSAEGMLARTYLNIAGVNPSAVDGLKGTLNSNYLDSAKYYADRVIKLSGKTLLPNYADLFSWTPSPYDNNNESLFELQWVFTTSSNLSYQYANTMISQITPASSISGSGNDGWGGNYTATKWMISLYDGMYNSNGNPGSTVDKRLKPTFMMPGATYPELIEKGTEANPVQYYAPITAVGNPSFATIKKYVIGYQKGQTGQQDNPNDTYMMRLAEMYLTYTEAAVLQGNVDALAVQYFNAVHSRAGLDVTHTTDSLSQGYPKAWDYVFKERAKEFAMEGLAWYDLVRIHYSDAQHAYNIIGSQDRGLWNYQPYPNPWSVANNTNPQGWTFSKITWFTNAGGNFDFITVNDGNFMLPIPTIELSQAPSLNQDPVAYDFANYK